MLNFLSFLKNRRGAVAVEFALVAPIFVLAITMTAELGMAAFDKMKLTAGVRSATQYVLQGGTDTNVMSAIVDSASGFQPTTTISQHCACSNAPSTSVSCGGSCSTGITLRSYTTITSSYERTVLLKKFTLKSTAEVRTN